MPRLDYSVIPPLFSDGTVRAARDDVHLSATDNPFFAIVPSSLFIKAVEGSQGLHILTDGE